MVSAVLINQGSVAQFVFQNINISLAAREEKCTRHLHSSPIPFPHYWLFASNSRQLELFLISLEGSSCRESTAVTCNAQVTLELLTRTLCTVDYALVVLSDSRTFVEVLANSLTHKYRLDCGMELLITTRVTSYPAITAEAYDGCGSATLESC